MKEPTREDLAAAVATLTGENAGLRDLLAAVSEYAASVPQAVYDDRDRQLSRATNTLTDLRVIADPDGNWAWSWGSGQGAAHLRELAAEPAGYEVYVKPESADATRDQPASPDAAEALTGAIVAGTPVVVTP